MRHRLRHVAERAAAGVEQVNGVTVRRFRVKHEREPAGVRPPVERCFEHAHSLADELDWLDAEGPTSPALVDYIAKHARRLRLLHLLQLSVLPRVPRRRAAASRAILVPTAERDAAIGSVDLPAAVQRRSRADVQLARRARDDSGGLAATRTCRRSSWASDPRCPRTRSRRASGRSSTSAGRSRSTSGGSTRTRAARSCSSSSRRYLARGAGRLSLVLIGNSLLPIPDHPRIRHLGFLDDTGQVRRDGGGRPADHAVVLREPVDGGARSVGARPAGARQRQVRRAEGTVHPQQRRPLLRERRRSSSNRCARSNSNRWLSATLGRNGRQFFREHYDWPVIERKYLDMLERLSKEPPADPHRAAARLVRSPTAGLLPALQVVAGAADGPVARSQARPPDRAPSGVAAAPPQTPPAEHAIAGPASASRPLPACPPRDGGPRRGRGMMMSRRRPAVHQVLATLGYGDAIGHEVLGIQRVLRRAGLRVGHLRRDGRPPARAADARLPRARRRQPSRQPAAPSFFDRLEGVANGVRAAGSDGAHLPQHHAARILRRRPPHAGAPVLPRPARASRLRRPLRSRARRLRVQPPGPRGARVSADRRAAGRARLLASRPASRTGSSPTSSTTSGPTSCSSAG